MKSAVLAAEDDRFYQHGGIDWAGVVRAGLANLLSMSKSQGASTITMQVARNFYLSSEKTYSRKFYELLLTFKIESELTNSPRRSVWCAGVARTGRISTRRTACPRLVNWMAASQPAR